MDGKNIANSNDSMDINELASLNDDISPELIEQLQQKLSQEANSLNNGEISPSFDQNDDTTLFEETDGSTPATVETQTPAEPQPAEKPKEEVKLNNDFDDNFIKKYKAKLSKQNQEKDDATQETEKTISDAAFQQTETIVPEETDGGDVEQISQGKIVEKKLTQEQKSYNDSLDFLDGNVKYSKYVIYIDPQNVDFIESLTVKERKNLINKIIREQDDILISKHKFKGARNIVAHVLIAIITFLIAVPIIYCTMNASLEATINNYRRSQSNFQTLYKEKGKITQIKQ